MRGSKVEKANVHRGRLLCNMCTIRENHGFGAGLRRVKEPSGCFIDQIGTIDAGLRRFKEANGCSMSQDITFCA